MTKVMNKTEMATPAAEMFMATAAATMKTEVMAIPLAAMTAMMSPATTMTKASILLMMHDNDASKGHGNLTSRWLWRWREG
mmetsp:Transcript_68386/g.113677  ORF Transcript_68386/g.113677 Transcript_68386/m.113677 type:complete len:81 (-) Transcript_68386:447-689(-)